MADKIRKCCGQVIEWVFVWSDEDGKWYEKTCSKCGNKIDLKCVLSEENKKMLGGEIYYMEDWRTNS